MNKTIELSRNNIIDFLNDVDNQKHGSIPVKYRNISDKEIADHAIKIFNHIAGENVYTQIPYTLDDKAQYLVCYTSRVSSGNLITIDDITYQEDLMDCVDSGENVAIKVNPKLIPVAKREGTKMGLSSDYDPATGVIVFRKRGQNSMYRRVENALDNGERFFIAPKTELSMRTARVYCSMIKKDNKFVSLSSISGGPDTYIWFDQPTIKERQMIDVKDLLYSVKDVVDKDELIRYFDSIYRKDDNKPVKKNIVSDDFELKGNTYIETLKLPKVEFEENEEYDVRIDQDYFNNESERDLYESGPTQQEQSETSSNSETNPAGAVRDVDGMQQYYIAELESDETESYDVFYDPNDF